jgi:hypothetical protein
MKPIRVQYLPISLFFTSRNTSIQNKKIYYMSAGFAGRLVVGFEDLSTDAFLEVPQKYGQILYLIDYIIASGLHLWLTTYIFKEICCDPISQHPGLARSLCHTIERATLALLRTY